METLLLSDHCPDDIQRAGDILRRGGLVAIPTETVYGLAANALDGEAVKKIYQAKGRPSDNPLIVHISRFSQLAPLVREVPESAQKLAAAFWPGPLTIILPKSDVIPQQTSGGLDTVAVRCPKRAGETVFTYAPLRVSRGWSFGQYTAVVLPEDSGWEMEVRAVSARFADGTAWTAPEPSV